MNISIKGTFKYAALAGAAIAAATLPLAASGRWIPFAIGLACGFGASMAGFAASYRLTGLAMATGSRGIAFAGIGLKIFLYIAVMFAMTALLGLWPGIGSAAGCLTVPVAILLSGVAAPKLRRMRGLASEDECRQYIYEPHMRSAGGALRYVFMRGSYMEMASAGRVYMTHRRFRRLAAIRLVPGGKAAGV